MPLCFQENFGNNVEVVIDCFEVFIEQQQLEFDACSNEL